ncbi:MAG TPA: L,D-transpeptidase family protein, partial [Myxococcus sp.]|nr:L,D-transpeptidase family protein [Myxococcus sp.]
ALLVVVLAVAGGSGGPTRAHAAAMALPPDADEVKARVEAHLKEKPGDDTRQALHRFYDARGFEPAWFKHGAPQLHVLAYLSALCDVETEGLRPEHYGHGELEEGLKALMKGGADDAWAGLELKLTSSFLTLASHLATGQLSPKAHGWHVKPRELDAVTVLHEAMTRGDVAGALRALSPTSPEYAGLKKALARYRALEAAGGWPRLPAKGGPLEPGMTDPRVRTLRERLQATGELGPPAPGTEEQFDATVEEAVKAFQQRHGLEPDGKVGGRTLAELRVPVEERIAQLLVNLERWRWMPSDFGERHVRVNVAAFELEAVRPGAPPLRMRVIAGEKEWATPVLTDEMSELVLNPAWAVPRRIASEDILPKLRADPGAAARMGLQVRTTDGEPVDASQVDWSALGEEPGPYRFGQAAGPGNPLGRLKFVLPNRFRVYLHDTPGKKHFALPERALSHGCVRVEQPEKLATYLLSGAEGWTEERLLAELETGKTQTVALPTPVPVHLLYWTAFATEDGQVHFRRDVYGRDARVREALGLEERPDADERESAPMCTRVPVSPVSPGPAVSGS